jgi:serine/threonine protein kinase
VDALSVLEQQGVVHCDLKPSNVVAFHLEDGFVQFKLIDFDSACLVGEAMQRGTLDYCAPEVYTDIAENRVPTATHAMDLYSLGRILMWLACVDDNLWPTLVDDCTDAEKETFLISNEEFALSNVEHDATRDLVQRLLRKCPQERLTLSALKVLPPSSDLW